MLVVGEGCGGGHQTSEHFASSARLEFRFCKVKPHNANLRSLEFRSDPVDYLLVTRPMESYMMDDKELVDRCTLTVIHDA